MTLEEAGHRINPALPADSLTTQLSRARGPRGESWGGRCPHPMGLVVGPSLWSRVVVSAKFTSVARFMPLLPH